MATCGSICSALADWDLVRAKFQIIRLLCKNLRRSVGLARAAKKTALTLSWPLTGLPLVFAYKFNIRGIQCVKPCNDFFDSLPQKLSRLNIFGYFIS